jgi:hypothetical protein
MPGGGVRVVHQNHEDEKNSSEFFECMPVFLNQVEEPEGSSPVSSLMRFDTKKSVRVFKHDFPGAKISFILMPAIPLCSTSVSQNIMEVA